MRRREVTMAKVLFNLTCHCQTQLAGIPEVASRWNVEERPRLRIVDPTNWVEMKRVVREALRDVPLGADVLVGGLGQLQALVMELGLHNIYYVLMRRANGSISARP